MIVVRQGRRQFGSDALLRSFPACSAPAGQALALILGIVLVLLAGCDGVQSPAPKDHADLQSLRLGLSVDPNSSLLIVALGIGAFSEVGIEPRVAEYPSGKLALLDGLLAGREDLITVADVPVALAGFTDAPLRIVASVFSTDDVNRVVTRRSLGIERPGDLAGRTVGTQRGSAVHFFWHLFSLDQHIHDQEQLRFLPAEELPAALADGRIDAFSMREPFVTEARTLIGDDLLVFSAPGLYGQQHLLVSSESMTRDHPDLLRRFVRALLAAEAYCRLQPEAAQALVAQFLSVPRERIAALWPDIALRVRLDQGLLLLLEEEARWAMDAGLVPSGPLPNYLDFIDADVLAIERPRAVTLIR